MKQNNIVLQLVLHDLGASGIFVLDFRESLMRVGTEDPLANCKIASYDLDFALMFDGKIDGWQFFMSGKLNVTGDGHYDCGGLLTDVARLTGKVRKGIYFIPRICLFIILVLGSRRLWVVYKKSAAKKDN